MGRRTPATMSSVPAPDQPPRSASEEYMLKQSARLDRTFGFSSHIYQHRDGQDRPSASIAGMRCELRYSPWNSRGATEETADNVNLSCRQSEAASANAHTTRRACGNMNPRGRTPQRRFALLWSDRRDANLELNAVPA